MKPYEFSEEAIRFAPWSMSKAKSATNCGLAFNLRYVQKIKGTTPPASPAERIGKGAHLVLEEFIKLATREDPRAKLAQLIAKASVDFKLTSPEIEELTALAHNINNFRNRLDAYRVNKGVTETRVERRFGLRQDMTPTTFWGKIDPALGVDTNGKPIKDIFFRGVWDLIMQASGYVIILDHKAGTPPKEIDTTRERHGDQLKLYAVAALCLYPELIGVQSGIHYVQNEEIIWDDMLSAEKIREELIPWYADFLNTAGAAATTTAPKIGWYCSFCEYVERCPLK